MIGLCAVVVLGAALALSPPVTASPKHPRLRSVETWAFAIGDSSLRGDVAARYRAYDLVVVDGERVTVRQVAALRESGTLVLAYLSVGTIEPGRWWSRSARPYRLDRWDDWGEWYAAVARPGFRRLLAGRVAPWLLRKGVDGLFLDNTDMVESHPRQAAGMRALVPTLARIVHRRGGLLFTQNGEDSIGPTLRFYDGWNREDVTSTYSFERRRYERLPKGAVREALAALRRFARRGLLVTTTDYVARRDAAGAAAAVVNACRAGALPYVGDILLTRVPARPYRCRR